MDKDAQMITSISNAIINLQVKYRSCNVADRMKLKPTLEELLGKFNNYQMLLLDEGVITTDEDLEDMKSIKKEIEKAGDTQQLLAALGKTIAFIIKKI